MNDITDEQVDTLNGTEFDPTFETADEPTVAQDVYYGSDAISKVSESLGRPLTFSEQRVVEEEGYVATPYTDTKGITTQGVGQTGEWIEKGFEAAFQHHVERAKGRVPSFDSLPETLQAELVQGEYRGDLGGSPNFLRLLNEGEYDLAADEFLDNKDYRDSIKSGSGVHKRMKRLSDAVRGQASGTEGTTGESEVVAPVKGDAVSGAAPLKSSRDIGDSEYKLIDGDTMINKRTGQSIRFGGFDAPETTKVSRKGGFQRGDQGGEEFTDAVAMVIEKGGFTNAVITDEDAGYGRKKGDLMNAEGVLLSDALIGSGIAAPSFLGKSDYSMSEDQYDLYVSGVLDRELRDPKTPMTDYEQAADTIRQAETAESGGQIVPKQMALDESHYSGMEDFYSGVTLRNKGAYLDNRSKTPFSQSFNVAAVTLKNSMAQVGSMVADVAGFDDTRDAWQGAVDFRKKTIMELPKVRLDYKDVNWTSIPEIAEYVTNNLAMSIPFMGVTVAAVAASPLTGGLSLTAPLAMHTGLVLDEMEGAIQDKNYAVAMVAGVMNTALDRFGLKGAVGAASVLNGEAKDLVVDKMMKASGQSLKAITDVLGDQAGDALSLGKLTKAQAELALTRLSKRELVSYAKDIDGLMAKQLTKTRMLKDFSKKVTSGAAFEGSTEMAQELTAYTAAVMGSEKTWDWDTLENRLINSAIAGGTMGAAFSAPGSVYDAGAWRDAEVANRDYDGRFDNAATAWKAEETGERGYVRDLDAVLEEEHMDARANTGRTRARPTTGATGSEYDGMMNDEAVDMSFEAQADRAQSRKEAKGGMSWLGDFAKDPMSAFRTALDTRMTTDLLNKSKTSRVIYDMFGGRKNQVHGGVDFHTDKVASYTLFEESITEIMPTLGRFNTKETGYGKMRSEVSAKIYDFHRDVIKPLTRKGKGNAEHMTGPEVIASIDWDNLPAKYRDDTKALKLTVSELYDVDNVMYNNITARQSMAGEEAIGKLQDHVFRAKAFEKNVIQANKAEFVSLLVTHKKLSRDDAIAVTDTILDNADASMLDDAFDLTKGGLNPAGYKKRSLDISDNKEFDKFLSNNIFDNLEAGMKGAARYMGSLKFIGKNNKLLGNMLDKVHSELKSNGDPDADVIVEDLAMNLRDLINADSGNYKRLESDMAKGIQKNLTLFGVVTMLPLAAPMSLVEFALAPMNVPMKSLNENVGSLGAILGKEVVSYVEEMGRVFGVNSKLEKSGLKTKGSVLDSAINSRKKRVGQDARNISIENPKALLGRVGMSGSQKTGQATLVGVSDTGDANANQAMDTFFKVIGLTGVTNATRTVRASLFNDFLTSNLDKIEGNTSGRETNESMEARQTLEEFGMPVSVMLNLSRQIKADPNNEEVLAKWAKQFDNGLYNFINGAVPMPNAMGRPLAYSNPHLGLFMQFQGFTSQFTANHIPRIWKTIAKGTPGMKYSTFAGLMSMLMLGYAAQYIKDYIKFGGSSPYLTDEKKYLRALYSSGLLGTPERLIANVFPLYEGRDKGMAMNMWEAGSGEAPAFGIVKNVYKLGDSMTEDDGTTTAKAALSLTPLLSPLKHRITNYWTGE
tara:strand:+ start:2155 stop:6885 length:4731 start_codon:yes stop_codon:yes gene_type:complete